MSDIGEKRDEELNLYLQDLASFGDPITANRARDAVGFDGTGDRATSWERIEIALASEGRFRGYCGDEDALRMALLGYYDGIYSGIELWNVSKDRLMRAIDKVREYRKSNRPLISIDASLSNSVTDIVFALRRMADDIEKNDASSFITSQKLGELPDHHSKAFGPTIGSCEIDRWSLGYSWKKGKEGEVLLETKCSETICTSVCRTRHNRTVCEDSNDATVLSIKTGTQNCKEVEVWNRSSGEEPSTTLPDFAGIPWNGCLNFYADNTGARLSSFFGWRLSEDGTRNEHHGGIDVTSPAGTEVRAVSAGRVIVSRASANAGDPASHVGVIVDTAGGQDTYWHVNPTVSRDSLVEVGQVVGTLYEWSNPKRHHLHFVRRDSNGDRIDPLDGCDFRSI